MGALILAPLLRRGEGPASARELDPMPSSAEEDRPTTTSIATEQAPDPEVVRAMIESARDATPTLIASDERIRLPMGGTWAVQVRVTSAPAGAAYCLENVGAWGTCTFTSAAPDFDGPRIKSYGGAPIPVVSVWSPTPFDGTEALLADGSTAFADAVSTDAGWFAAFAFRAENPPITLSATTPERTFDLGLAAYVGPDGAELTRNATY